MLVSDVRAILLIPTETARKALLGDGPCGLRVPQAWHYFHEDYGSPTGGEWDPEWTTYDADGEGAREPDSAALCLAWDGRSTGPEGLARALAVLVASKCPATLDWLIAIVNGGDVLEGGDLAERLEVAMKGEARGLWRVEVVRG